MEQIKTNKPEAIMKQYKNPGWWTRDHETAWNCVKEAMKRDWMQTKRDWSGDEIDVPQNTGTTLRQTIVRKILSPCDQLAYETWEPAYRFGYGARLKFGSEYSAWNTNLEICLARDWRSINATRRQTWDQDREAIRYGWNYNEEVLEADDEGEDWKRA
jgi:hypothetical protein